MSMLPAISMQERRWNADIASRRPDLVIEEAAPLERMTQRYLELAGHGFGMVAAVLTDRARVLRHLVDEATEDRAAHAEAAREAGSHLSALVGAPGDWTEPQAERLAALIHAHPGAQPDVMPTGDGRIVVSFGPRRGNGAYVVEPDGSSRWVTPARYAA